MKPKLLSLSMVGLSMLAACPREQPGPDAGVPFITEEEAHQRRLACAFGPGAMPADTLATSAPKGDAMPIDHIILIMQENRSFDHYFSTLDHPDVDLPPPGASNRDADGGTVQRYHESHYCVTDVPHEWNSSHIQWNDGGMDNFVAVSEPDGRRAMGYYDATDLPYYHALAKAFAISDRHFCSLLGPTLPNRMFYFAGTSWGRVANATPPPVDEQGHPHPNIFYRMTDARVSWKIYSDGPQSPLMFLNLYEESPQNFLALDAFFADMASGALPAVSIVEANFAPGGSRSDEHAPSNIQLGQAFTASVVNALMASSAWPRSALFFTYDEHGGFYDHVSPPPACQPDDFAVVQGFDVHLFDRLGFRVPLIVVSPFARRGYVSHQVTDLTSITRFLETRFNLPAMTARDANAYPMLDMFDFAHPDLSVPNLPTAEVDATEAQYCQTHFPGQ